MKLLELWARLLNSDSTDLALIMSFCIWVFLIVIGVLYA